MDIELNMIEPFYQQTLIYLTAAVIAVPIAKRFGLGSVLGFLIAGMVIGPWGFKLITDVNSIMQFAEFGVALLLFLIGLELNPQRLWRLRRSILGMGSIQVILSIIIFTLLGLLFKLPFPIALVAGMGFTMSSTSIALQSLTEKNILNTSAGQSILSVSLFQDIMVIPLMLVLTLLAPHKVLQTTNIYSNIFEPILIIFGLIVAGRYLLRPILRVIANTGLREIFISFSLLLVISIAILMRMVGLSMALGTFLAGVILADSEYRYQLELDIEPFKGLLLGLFFIAIGMSLNIGIILQHPIIVLLLTLLIVSIKIVILYCIERWFKESSADAKIFACYLSQIGEFAFVLFNFALIDHILTPAQVDLFKCIVAISMLTTPFLLIILEKKLLATKQVEEKPADIIDEHNPVIIAGFGRVGGIISRLLMAKGIRTTIIDHDPNQISLVQKYGYRAYYGDISRLDLLISAGAAKAKLLILAIDDREAILATITLAKQYFPHLKLIVRARGRADAFEFIALNVTVFRETFGSALNMSEAALINLGSSPLSAKRAVQKFQEHDIAQLKKGARKRDDEQALISLSQQGRVELEKLLAAEEKAIEKEQSRN